MRFHHVIEATDNAQDPTWYVIREADEVEEYEGDSSRYGRDVLTNWLDDENSEGIGPALDEYNNPYRRVIIRFDDEDGDIAATIGADDLDEPADELAAVEEARTAKLYAKHLDSRADGQLEEAFLAARAKGHGANELARLAAPALSRPIALRMMRTT
ncbi:hypothetical protein [Streptomyces virginiae]|uniref:hypothetical protein n=1 Tax=Streptomyces virginiae TaxID=1961 RepID=UPI00224D0DA0|nr:hypothetical protein [Streptomyces virginiae]MCX5176698.1 hypothetical protein [Streptomyces virginiae]